MPEYLAAGVPILVYAPPDSYLARYASEHGFAEVVTEPDAVALARALRRLTTDSLHVVELTRHAAETLRRHRSELIAGELRRGVADAIADPN